MQQITLINQEINKINEDRYNNLIDKKQYKNIIFNPLDNSRDLDILINLIQFLNLSVEKYLNKVLEVF